MQAVLDEELNRLPEKYRRPFILCCLEARSKKEAAEEPGWKEGTVSSRLAHARNLLQQRLARRGVELSAVLAGVAVALEGASAAVPAGAATTILQAALSFTTGGPGVSAQAVRWAQAVLRAQALARAKFPAALLLFARAHEGPLRLERAQAFRGSLIGPDGRPARGVRLYVVAMERRGPGALIFRFRKPPRRLPAWPESVTTDDNGRFVFDSLGPNLLLDAEVHDERYATQRLALRTGPREQTKVATYTLAPPVVLEGRITGADSGLPPPGASVFIQQAGLTASTLPTVVDGRTDAEGRFRLRPFPGKEFSLDVYPPPEAPYLRAHKQRFPWPAGAARHELSLALRRGVLIRGKVREEGSGRPVAGAAVQCVQGWSENDAPGADRVDRSLSWWNGDTRTAADGSFALAAFRAPGHLLIRQTGRVRPAGLAQLHSPRPGDER